MKQTLWLLAAILLFFAGDRAAAYFLSSRVAGSQFRYSRLYHNGARADVLLVGNSRGLTFYQPYIESASGRTSYNLSYNGMPAELAQVLVLDYLDRYPAPESMVVDITLCDRPNDELIGAFFPYMDDSPRLDTFLRRKMPKFWWGAQVSKLTRYNNEVFQRALYYQNRSDEDWLLDRVIADKLAASVHEMRYGMNPALIRPLTALVAAARNKGVKVQLVIGPYFPGFARQVDRLDELKQAVEQATGLPVHDYRDALNDPSAFGDLQHPNKKGSIAYIDLLRKDGVLP